MKVDKGNPYHWGLLGAFFLQALLGLLSRRGRTKLAGSIVLYGHKLNGNLLALHEFIRSHPDAGLESVFLTMDREYHRELLRDGVSSVWAASPDCARVLSKAAALVSDHGLHALQPLRTAYGRMGLAFFDVWHGIPFKGFDAKDFKVQLHYDEVWVASPLVRDLYIRSFGFSPERVVATGYARTDRLLATGVDDASRRASLGLPSTGRLVLFAPTWKQDAAGRSLYPFGCSERDFLGQVADLARRHGASVVLRSHLNSGEVGTKEWPNVYALPASRYPDAESILRVCDLLVCDWSSIAFDFLLLDRPTIFLDVVPPFRKGFSLGPEYRFGPVVDDVAAMIRALDDALAKPLEYWRIHGGRHLDVKQSVYGGMADGFASARCIGRLQAHAAGAKVRRGSSR